MARSNSADQKQQQFSVPPKSLAEHRAEPLSASWKPSIQSIGEKIEKQEKDKHIPRTDTSD